MLQYLSKVLKRLTVLHLAPPISVRHPTSMHTLVACKVTSYNISTAVQNQYIMICGPLMSSTYISKIYDL